MAAKKLPDAAYLHECFAYDPDTGVLVWRVRPVNHFVSEVASRKVNTRFSGKPAGSLTASEPGGSPFISAVVGRKRYKAHRIIWVLVHGVDPDGLIDHKDGDGLNNRLNNLRDCTHTQNCCNRRGSRPGKLKGAYFNRNAKLWVAHIKINRKQKNLGYYKTEAEAHAAYCAAAPKYHGEFACIDR